MIILAVLVAFLVTGVLPVSAAYGINRTINFQGKLVTSSGVNVPNSTPVTATFSIYQTNSSCPGGGTAVWSENQTFTPTDGVFQIALGSQTAFGTSIDFSQDTLYLGIQISGEVSEMCSGASRIKLAAVPYAFNAESFAGLTADDSQSGLFTITGGTGTTRTLTVNGDVTVGSTITPTAAGGLTIQSSGANTMTVDTGGAATLSLGASSSIITIGSAGATGVSISDDNWSVGAAGAASFTSITAATDNSINASNYGVDFTDSDTNPACAAGDYKVFADTSDGKLKKCQNGAITDLAQNPDVVSRAKSENQNVTSSTTLTDETALQFDIGANEEWNVVWDLVVSNNNDAGPDWKSAVVGPTSNSCTVLMSGSEPGGTAFPQVSTTDCIEVPGTLVNGTIVASTVPFNVTMTANIATGATSGIVKMQFAQDTSDTTALTVLAGSMMRAYKVTGADLAEFYYSLDNTIEPGDVVALDSLLPDGVRKSGRTYDGQTMGIVSTNPGLVMGSGSGRNGGYPVLVALSGRVPVKVSTENGAIRPGDMLTASTIPGVAMKMTKTGMGIGMAMTAFDGEGLGRVTVFVKTGWTGQSRIVEPSMGVEAFDDGVETEISELIADRVVAGLEIVTPLLHAEQIFADRITAREISGLSDMIASESAKYMVVNTPFPTNSPTPTLDMKVLGELLAMNGLTVTGSTILGGSVEFKEAPEFNSDMAGYGVLHPDTERVEIVFEKEYKHLPIVIITDNNLRVIESTAKGFWVTADKTVKEEINFKWIAIAVKNPKKFESILPTPTPIPTAMPTPVPTLLPAQTVIDVASASATPPPE